MYFKLSQIQPIQPIPSPLQDPSQPQPEITTFYNRGRDNTVYIAVIPPKNLADKMKINLESAGFRFFRGGYTKLLNVGNIDTIQMELQDIAGKYQAKLNTAGL